MPAAGAGELDFPTLPANAKKLSKLKGLQVPLVSVKQLCAHGMIVIFYGSVARAFDKSESANRQTLKELIPRLLQIPLHAESSALLFY